MEQDVAGRHFSQEQHSSQLQSWHNGTVNGRGTHQDNGQPTLCHDHLRGRCTRGSFCIYKHSGVVDHRSDRPNLGYAADPRNSLLVSDYKDGDSSRRSFIGESRSRSPCRMFQSGCCFRGSSCPYLHPQFSNFCETSVDDSSRSSFFGEGGERSPCRNFQIGRCNLGSTCPYLHPDFSESKGLTHDWNVAKHHGVLTASNNSRFHERNVGNNLQRSVEHHGVVPTSRNLSFHERNVDNNLLTSDEHDGVVTTSRNSRFHGGNMVYDLPTSQVLDAANNEGNSRISISIEPQNRSPCRFFLQGRCNLGASCRYWHPVNAQPKIPGISHNHGFVDGATAINQETVDPNSTSSFEKHHISQDSKTTVALEKHERIGVNVDMNHELNEKTGEADHLVKTYSRKKSFKQKSSSSVVNDSFNQMNVALVSGLSADCISTGVPGTNDIGIVLAYNQQELGSEIVSINFQKTGVQSSSAITVEGNLHGDIDNSAMPASQPSDITIPKSRRKLLILDVNGLLVDIVVDFPDILKPNAIVGGKGVFKRPFFDDFLQFCFEKFDVGIWTSRTVKNLTKVLESLMENTKDRLLFCWHQSHCTQTGYITVENNAKPLILKELKKLWKNVENDLPWKKGFYDETNTILLDDSPYKALRNPPYTAVFPYPYSFKRVEDKSLGPDGDLRLYLERLSEAENVQKFIQENPFGQRPITKNNPSGTLYSKIAGEYASQLEGISSKTSNS